MKLGLVEKVCRRCKTKFHAHRRRVTCDKCKHLCSCVSCWFHGMNKPCTWGKNKSYKTCWGCRLATVSKEKLNQIKDKSNERSRAYRERQKK